MMPEKRELKRLEELAKKKKRLLLLQQRLLTDATLPSMEPTTSRRKLELSKDDSSPSQRSARSSKSGTKSTPTASIRKRSTLSSSSTSALADEERESIPNISEKSSSLASSRDSSPRGAKRSSKASEAHEAIMENLAKKLKSATPTVSRTGSAKKSASKSRDNSPLKSKSRDCSPRQIPKDASSSSEQAKNKDESIGRKPKSRDPSPRIAKLKNSETASDKTNETVKSQMDAETKDEKPNENVAKQSRQKLSAVDSLSDKDTLLLLKPTIPEKVSSSNPLEIGTQTDQEVVKRRRRKGKLKRLVQTAKTQVKNSEQEQSFHRGRPKGSKNKKWSGNAGVKTKLRGTSCLTPAQQPTRKRTLSGEFELIDERQLKRDIKSKEMDEEKEETEALLDTSNDNIFIEETCEQLDFSDTEYDDEEHMEELVLEPSPSKSDAKPTPRKLSEVMEPSLAKSDAKLSEKVSTEVLESSPLKSDDQPTPKKTPEIVKLLSVKKKATEEVESSSLKSENLETVSVKSETGEPMSENESKCGPELNPKESTSGDTEATENVSCETQCDFVDEKDESDDKPDSKPKEEVSLKETPEKIEASSPETQLEISSKKRGRRPTSIIKTVTEIMVKPSGETTKLRTITTKSEKDDSVTELSSVDTKHETVSRNLFISQDDDVESVQSVSSFSDASSLSSNSKGTKSRDLSVVKKKKKREVFTYRHKRFTRKKKRKVDLMLNKSIDSSLDDNQDNGDIPVLSPTETQFPDVPNTDLPSPLLNMPVLMKEQLPKPIKRRGRPRILPIKIPSGRGRGRPRKPADDMTNEMILSSELLGVEIDADPVIHTSISPTISYSTVELDFGLDKEQKTDDGTVIADIVNGLVNDVCRDMTILKAKQDSTKLETGKIPLKIPLGPRLKGKKGHKRKGHHMQSKHAGPKHSKSRSLHSINCTPIESLSWKLDNSGSPEGSTKLVFKRRKQTNSLKSMSERENSLFLAEVEQLIREKEKSTTDVPSRARQFMLREKVSRSPLEILAMKDKLEEEEYEKSQIPKRKPRSKQKYESSDNLEEPLPSTSQEPEEAPVPLAPVPPVSVKYNGPVHEMKSLCKPCHVPVINIVSYVNKHMEGDGHELDENAFSDGIDISDSDKSYVLTEEEQSEYDNEEEMFRKKFVAQKMEKSVPIKEVEPDSKNSIKIDELKEDGYIASYVEFLKSQSEPTKPKTPKIAKVTPIMKTTTEKPQESNSSTSTVASSGNSASLTSSKPDVSNSSSSVSSSTAVVPPSTHQSPPTVSSTSETTEGSPVQQYSCKSCDFSSPVKNQIENHIYTHISHVVFRCASCNSQDRTLAAAQRHQNAAHPHSNQNIIKIPRVREEDYYNTTKSNHPFYVSLVVQGNFSLNTSSIRNPSNRFVCTHCQYSTNIKEDIDQHILDLHKNQELFVCTLCDRAMYHSTTEIQAHCQQTHPSRPDCFRKLPHFYDCELTDSSERGRTDGRGNIFDRMTNFLNPVQSSNDHQNAESDRIRCAKEYLNIQDSINKRANESGNSSPSEVIVQAPVVEEVSEEPTKAKDAVDDTPRITEITDLTSTSETVTHAPREHSIARSILQGNTVIVDNESSIKTSNSNTTTSQILCIPVSQGPGESPLSTAGTSKMVDEHKHPDVEKIAMVKEGDNINNSIDVDDDVSEPKSNEPMEDSDGLGGLKIISVVSLQGQNFTDDASSSKKETAPVNLPFTQSPLVIPRPQQINVPQKQKLLLPKPSQTLLTAVEKKPPKPKDILPKAPVSVDDIVLRNERLTCTYKCKICNVHAPFLSVIVEHLMQHHQSICVFTCPYCKLSEGKKPDFKTELKARDHIAKHHPSHYAKKDTSLSDSAKEIVQVVAIPSSADFQRGKTSNIERDIYMCQKCSTHLPSLNYMYSHIENEHDDVFLHVCPECKKYKHKSEDVVYKHVMDVHLKDPSKVDLSLAMEDNLFTRIYSISKNAVYSEKSHSSEESNPSNIKHGLASESSQQSSSLSTTVQNVVKKRPTARKSMKRVDDITEARALVIAANQNRKTPSPSVTQHRPIIGSQLFTDCSTVTTTSVTSSTTKAVSALVPVLVSQPPSSLPRKQPTPVSTSIMQTTPVIQKSNYLHLSSDEASQLAKQKHLPVGYKTVAQQLKERKLIQLQSAILKQQAADDAGVSSSPSLTQSEHYLATSQQNESVQSKKFSMTDRLHRLNKPSTSTTGTPILNVPKPVLKVPSMDKIRNLARPKSLPSASESVDITMAQEMSNYPGILRPPAASSSSPRSLSGFSMNTAPKGPSPKPQPSLLFPRGLSPKLPVKSPVPIDADTDDPEAFKIFNLKPSKPSASQGKPPQTSTPPVPNLKGPFPQLVNLPTGIQFPQIPINIGGQAGQIPSIFTQGFPGVVLLQPQALNNAVMSPVNAFGAEPQGFAGINTFKCPYCSTVLERNAVRPHIEGMHKGCAVIYKPLGM